MKCANILHRGLGKTGKNKIFNLGDFFETLAIERLYIKNGIPESEIVSLDLYDLESYCGENLLLPINFMFMSNISNVNLFNISRDIKPVFLGVSILNDDLDDDQLCFLKKNEPIGCRDELSKNLLIKKGIEAYQGGCIVGTFDSTCNFGERNQVAFIDVPREVERYVPEEIKARRVFLNHEFYLNTDDESSVDRFKECARKRIDYYDKNVALIVTSRFHAAVIAIALQIPVIVTVENNFYKFSWISKVAPFYERNQFAEIDWSPGPIQFAQEKKDIGEIAQRRVFEGITPLDIMTRLDRALHNPLRSDTRALHYVGSAIDYINTEWTKDKRIEYAVWGINDNAQILCEYIHKNYKNSVLSAVYDGLRKTVFRGMETVRPTADTVPKDVFVFVTSNTASKPAVDLFSSIGKDNYYICTLDFIKGVDKDNKVGFGELK